MRGQFQSGRGVDQVLALIRLAKVKWAISSQVGLTDRRFPRRIEIAAIETWWLEIVVEL